VHDPEGPWYDEIGDPTVQAVTTPAAADGTTAAGPADGKINIYISLH